VIVQLANLSSAQQAFSRIVRWHAVIGDATSAAQHMLAVHHDTHRSQLDIYITQLKAIMLVILDTHVKLLVTT